MALEIKYILKLNQQQMEVAKKAVNFTLQITDGNYSIIPETLMSKSAMENDYIMKVIEETIKEAFDKIFENTEEHERKDGNWQSVMDLKNILEPNRNDKHYVIILYSKQFHALLSVCELLMRLKLKQYNEIPFYFIKLAREDFCEKRDYADQRLKIAFELIFKDKINTEWKDAEWYNLYNIYQVSRYSIEKAEYPKEKYPYLFLNTPIRLSEEPLPTCVWQIGNNEEGEMRE